MTSKLLFASGFALAVVLLVLPSPPGLEAAPRDDRLSDKEPAQAREPGQQTPRDAAPRTVGPVPHGGSSPRFGRPPALQGVQRDRWVSSEASLRPLQASMPAGPASVTSPAASGSLGSGLQGAVARPGNAAPDTPGWRDSARELLSQIGVLCPAVGCDSLEDD